MFTGLVVERGRLSADPRRTAAGGLRLALEFGPEVGGRLTPGASLAVAGVCLTVLEPTATSCEVELSQETLARTRLGRLREGDEVNLEPALRVGDPMGGHWVQGHVDGLARLVSRRDDGEHSRFRVRAPAGAGGWLVEKGSVALDGVSLTLAWCDGAEFDVALIPHTLEVTTLGAARPGDRFHFEGDILAKYVERALAGRGGAAPA